jgi:hypothetical protein
MVNHAGGISVIAFVVAIAVSIGYYQFVFIPEANAKPTLPEAVLNPVYQLMASFSFRRKLVEQLEYQIR